MKEYRNADNGDGADRQIDVKTPSPSGMVSENAAEQRTGNTRDLKVSNIEAKVTPNMAPIRPKNMGRFLSGTVKDKMVRHPEKMPPAPRPAIALPTMNTVLFGATPQIREPSSKIDTTARKTTFKLKFW